MDFLQSYISMQFFYPEEKTYSFQNQKKRFQVELSVVICRHCYKIDLQARKHRKKNTIRFTLLWRRELKQQRRWFVFHMTYENQNSQILCYFNYFFDRRIINSKITWFKASCNCVILSAMLNIHATWQKSPEFLCGPPQRTINEDMCPRSLSLVCPIQTNIRKFWEQ